MMETKLENILTNSYKVKMISYLKSHPEDFEEAIKLAIDDKQPYSWRAAWLLWSCMEKNDHRINVYIEQIIDTLQSKNDNQQRELLMILQRMKLSDDYTGKLFDICVNIWEKTAKQASVRYNAFKLIVKIVKNNPELLHEVKMLIEPHYMDPLSDTVKKIIVKMIRNLKITDIIMFD